MKWLFGSRVNDLHGRSGLGRHIDPARAAANAGAANAGLTGRAGDSLTRIDAGTALTDLSSRA